MRAKQLILTAVVAFVVASLVALGLRELQPQLRQTIGDPLPDALIVYCFHGNVRCPKCEKIESYTHEVLEKSFAVPLEEGQIVWRVLNYEEPQNAYFADDYEIVTSCIVLVDARSGQPGVWKNLQQKVWELVDDKEAFQKLIQGEVQEALK